VTASVVVAGPGFRAGRPAAALRVAADVLDLLAGDGDGSCLYVKVYPQPGEPVSLHVFAPDAAACLARLLAHAGELGEAVSAKRYSHDSMTKLAATFVRDGVSFELWASFDAEELLSAYGHLASCESAKVLDDVA
jgi:hypothetical protein